MHKEKGKTIINGKYFAEIHFSFQTASCKVK
jgi:hypothetical protein